ncbi:hypothetical protein VP01_4350g1 [Puccinia sorghi]|uniref:Uncharacterized protein n=1 Tax=Puccinia sorghi TaxID=27349 RepID=A0A0L6UPV1_9BASI|nr:hypothetical protein VP01_4350g1 [Puccinia sorghi]
MTCIFMTHTQQQEKLSMSYPKACFKKKGQMKGPREAFSFFFSSSSSDVQLFALVLILLLPFSLIVDYLHPEVGGWDCMWWVQAASGDIVQGGAVPMPAEMMIHVAPSSVYETLVLSTEKTKNYSSVEGLLRAEITLCHPPFYANIDQREGVLGRGDGSKRVCLGLDMKEKSMSIEETGSLFKGLQFFLYPRYHDMWSNDTQFGVHPPLKQNSVVTIEICHIFYMSHLCQPRPLLLACLFSKNLSHHFPSHYFSSHQLFNLDPQISQLTQLNSTSLNLPTTLCLSFFNHIVYTTPGLIYSLIFFFSLLILLLPHLILLYKSTSTPVISLFSVLLFSKVLFTVEVKQNKKKKKKERKITSSRMFIVIASLLKYSSLKTLTLCPVTTLEAQAHKVTVKHLIRLTQPEPVVLWKLVYKE